MLVMNDKRNDSGPRARKEGLVVQQLPDEVLIYDLNRHRAHCLNGPAAMIWRHCDGKTSAAKMAALLETELKRPVDESTVLYGLDQLEKARLLDAPEVTSRAAKMTRREAARKIGLAALVGLPLVTSIVAPTAAQAATCLSAGTDCSTSAQCCSGLCIGNKCQ
jgi:hypothetical protein